MTQMKRIAETLVSTALLAMAGGALAQDGAIIFVIGGMADDPFWSIVKGAAEDAGRLGDLARAPERRQPGRRRRGNYLLAAIAAGKPGSCEKPLATTEAAGLNVLDADMAFGRRLVRAGLMRRPDADDLALERMLEGGVIGAPPMFPSRHRNASVPAGLYTSDMPLTDALVHDADIPRWLLDDEVAAVEVRVPRRSRRGGDLRDPVFVLLHMASGVLADGEISVGIQYGYDIRGEISGETGVAALPERPGTVLRAIGRHAGHIPEDWRERFSAAYDLELCEWIDRAPNGTATGPSTWNGYAHHHPGERRGPPGGRERRGRAGPHAREADALRRNRLAPACPGRGCVRCPSVRLSSRPMTYPRPGPTRRDEHKQRTRHANRP